METNLLTPVADNFINKPIGSFKPSEQTSPATMNLPFVTRCKWPFVRNGHQEFRNVEFAPALHPNRR
jgi:hypothetical protein